MKRALILVALVACEGPTITGTTCDDDKDCNLFNVQGRCEPTGYCSFPDPSCASGQRYAPGGEFDNACVDGPTACGGKDQACCGTSVCAANLVCVIEQGTCQCGGAGQPCCDGTTCSTGLRCGTDATCSSSEVEQVAAGAGHACVLFADRTVACWGYDYKPYPTTQGVGDAVIASTTPVEIAGATDVAELRAAEMHTCARKMDNTLWCWGHGENGQLGNGANQHSLAAVQVAGLTNVTMFDGGRTHSCALGNYNGSAGLWCWGRGGIQNRMAAGTTGRLGNGSAADSNLPVRVDLTGATAAGQMVRSLSTGAYHSCVVMSDNNVWCWGRNANGELGNNATAPSTVPVQVNFASITIPNGVTVDQVSCSDGRRKQGSTCIRLSNGTVYCWGANARGELGDGGTVQRLTPSLAVNTTALGTAKIVQLASSQWAKCGRTDGGSVWCWGENKNGIVGINAGMASNVLTPQAAMGLTEAAQLDMSHYLACTVTTGKQLYCWGTNRRGQATARGPITSMNKMVLAPTLVAF